MSIEENIEKMNKYIKKQQLLGDDLLNFNILEGYSKRIVINKGTSKKWLTDSIDLVIPSFVNLIRGFEFEGTNSIKSISFEKDSEFVKVNEHSFSACRGIESIDFSNCKNKITINDRAFVNCSRLTNVEFGNTEYIGESAFRSTSIAKVVMKNELITICNYAFYGCQKLSKVEIVANELEISKQAFNNCKLINSADIHISKLGK